MRQFMQDYVRGLGMSARNNTLAYGYSIAETASFAVLSRTAGPASVGHIFLFVIGASLAFGTVNAVVTRGFRRRVEGEPPVVVSLATSLSVISISGAVGAVTLLGLWIGGWTAWILGALIGTWIYLSVAALEVATARILHLSIGDKDPAHR